VETDVRCGTVLRQQFKRDSRSSHVTPLSDLLTGSSLAVLAGILIFFFVVQGLAASWQARRMLATMKGLYQQGGTLAVGLSGNIYRRKVYGFVVADDAGTITNAQILKGWTVFARPRPVEALTGLALSDLLVEAPQIEGVSKKDMQAFSMAARTLTDKLEAQQAELDTEVDGSEAVQA
jgi:DNA-binding transcriptional regulator of glucitol operon